MTSHLRLTLLVFEGYLYLALIVAIFLLPTGLLVWGVLTLRPFAAVIAVLVGIPVVVTTARAVRALWLVFPNPDGVEIDAQFGARLHQTVAEIARRVGAPPVHRVLVSELNNASALQTRSASPWPMNTLVLGYPLLATLSVDQVCAVIAHELAHFTHEHGRFSGWVYRTQMRWIRLLDVLERHRSVPAHVYLLFRFYVPRLSRRAADVSRQHERVADRLAADVAGAEVTAQALVAIEVGHYVLERTFWPRVFDRLEHEPEPPNPFSEMGPDIWTSVEDRNALLDELLSAVTRASDTHPALRDRLATIGQSPRWPDAPRTTAADEFFGVEKQALADALGKPWRAAREEWWRGRHDEIRSRRRRLAALAELPSPTPEQTFERGELLEQDGHRDEALELYRSASRSGHARAGLAAGRMLLEREDESGIALITAVMDDPALIEEGCEAIIDFLEGRGRHAEAHQYRTRMTRHATTARMANSERAELSSVDRFRPCTDPRIDAGALTGELRRHPAVMQAFLVTKELRYSSGTQTVLAVIANRGGDLQQKLRGSRVLPEDVVVVMLRPHEHALETALREVPGAILHTGPRP